MTAIRPRTEADLPRCVDLLAAVHVHDAYPSRWPADPAGWLSPRGLDRAWVAEARPAPEVRPAPGLRPAPEARPATEHAIAGHIGVVRTFSAPALLAAVDRPAHELAGIVRLFIAPAARHDGHARDLLAVATDHIRRQGWLPALDVVESGSAAIALYERLGWQHVASTRATWVDDSGAHPMVRYYVAPA